MPTLTFFGCGLQRYPRIFFLPMGRLGLLVWLLPAFLSAQINFATLSGTIEDPQRRPIRQARVQLTSAATGAARATVAGTGGLYDFASLAPGDYQLNVEASGFAVFTRSVRLEVGQQMRLDLVLTLGRATESVDVVAFMAPACKPWMLRWFANSRFQKQCASSFAASSSMP